MTTFKIRLIAAFAVFFTAMAYGTAMAEEIAAVSLWQCEQDAISNSAKLRQINAQALSLEEAAKAAHSAFYPSLSLDAQGGYVSDTPELKTGNISMKYGDNWSYNIGTTAKYILYDGKGRRSNENAQRHALAAKKQEAENTKKQIILQTRQAYFALQENLENIYLLNSQLELARTQLKDINSAYKAGTKNALDVLLAKKQANSALAKIGEARAGLSAALRNLFRLTGTDYGINPQYPLDFRLAKAALPGSSSALIQADGIKNILAEFEKKSSLEFDSSSPRLSALSDIKEYYLSLSESIKAALAPAVSLSGGAYLQYPNGPVKESVFLGKAGAAISLPLFEGKKSSSQSMAQKHNAAAADYERQDTAETLKSMFLSAKDRLYALSVEEEILKTMEKDSEQAAKLAYEAYKAGTMTFFEVDNANLQLLECRMSISALQTKKLNALAVIDSLGK